MLVGILIVVSGGPARRFGLALALCLVLPLSGCGLFASTPKPQDAMQSFLDDFGRGNTDAAAKLTDNPAAAKPVLDKVRSSLKAVSVTGRAVQVTSPESDKNRADATLSFSWDLGKNRRWTYQSLAALQLADTTWLVHWQPSLIHPQLADQQTLADREVQPDVAPVLDRSGVPLLAPDQAVTVTVDKTQAGDLNQVAAALAAALSRFDQTITAQSITDGATGSPNGFAVVTLRNTDYQQVRSQIHELPGVRFSSQTRLLSPDRNVATQILGIIRKSVEDKNAGKAGWRIITVNSVGDEVQELFSQPAQPAEATTVTLDHAVQLAADQAVGPIPQPAVLVAMQPSTGDILAVAQNAPADAQGPIALSGQFPPGSSFKILTAATALGTGKATADTVLPCPGTITVQGRVIPNENQFDKGLIPLHSAFAYSCNTTFAQLATGFAPDDLTKTAKQFGIGVDYVLPGVTTVTGRVPAATDVLERASDGFGQGRVVVSPLGMALVASTVATGSTPTPDLIRGVTTTSDTPPAPVAQPVLDAVRQMMREVVTAGTARQLQDLPDVAGKTGTAQFGDGAHSHGWFVGTKGDLAYAALIVGGETSTPAVTMTGTFLRALH